MPGVWETEAEWRRLKRELGEWHARRRLADATGQHHSQLQAAHTLVDGVLDRLHGPITAMTTAGAHVSEACRVHDRRLAWLRRLWEFLRVRLDQRDDAVLGPVLRAADEVVWSCYREPFASLGIVGDGMAGPPPLPFVEPGLTPEVFPQGLVPGELRRDVDAPFLRAALEQLPFAVVRVPASCATAPWWLVHLGHEVGHVVDAQLLGPAARARLVDGCGLDPATAQDWTRWSGETFADLYAALMHGPWALWALSTAETQDPAGLSQRRDSYPPPAVRLLVMAHALDRLGAPLDDLQTELARWQAVVDADASLSASAQAGRHVVEALLTERVQRSSWRDLADWAPGDWRRKALLPWSQRLTSRPATPEPKPRRADIRAAVAATVMRRRDGDATPTAFDGDGIGADLLAWLPALRERGTRGAAGVPTAVLEAQCAALARDLMDAEPLP
ncbi:hypothetical protein TBR22_A51550 [Luteitalea sp. TBR-22]|uniref:hypothetical protein n=1 Tax=Luteitalea sp. TBR-22 TaxID=2802971 RepID=UPI001AF60EBC|nr:hypothetical protein [Luteitalea sp. TBR-22]BCS35920.1 hypothetical protein TBR22_A51550 [Luteitalea sp. TBR-22]